MLQIYFVSMFSTQTVSGHIWTRALFEIFEYLKMIIWKVYLV